MEEKNDATGNNTIPITTQTKSNTGRGCLSDPKFLKQKGINMDEVHDNNDGSSHLSINAVDATMTMATVQPDGSSHLSINAVDATKTMATA